MYLNGEIPESELIIFNRGQTVHWKNGHRIVEDWYWGLTPGTYRKHLALVARARARTGRTLLLSQGFSCYRPLYGQRIARLLHGIYAAVVGTSSHGGFWEGRETLAMDYGNWDEVYGGDRVAWFDDVRAVGLKPGMISPGRGYPDEPWHVIDPAPWASVPAGDGATEFPTTEPATTELILEEDDMKLLFITDDVDGSKNKCPGCVLLNPRTGATAAYVRQDHPKYQERANSWARVWGNARPCTRQDMKNAIAAIQA